MRCTPEALAAALQDIDRRALRRHRIPAIAQDASFCSNDYLGLARDPRLAAALAACAQRDGTGAGASHLISGHSSEHEALEQELAEFTGRERALVFSTGYMANLGVITALAGRDDLILEDRLNHASLIDAGLLARTRRLQRYAHADVGAAAAALAAHSSAAPQAATLLVTDGVFSMDGDLAPLPELAALALRHQAWLIVDDAHGIGVLGKHGGGLCEHLGLSAREVPVLIGTFGKALGTFGAFVAGDATLIEWLIQSARTYRYTTALPPSIAAATRCALRIVREEAWRREALAQHIAQFREGARARGLSLASSPTPIQPLILGSATRALKASARLQELGYRIPAIRPPTVPEGESRLRITLTATQSTSDIDGLLDALERIAHD